MLRKSALVILGAVLCLGIIAAEVVAARRLQTMRQQVNEMRKQVGELNRSIADAKASFESGLNKLTEINKRLDRLEGHFSPLFSEPAPQEYSLPPLPFEKLDPLVYKTPAPCFDSFDARTLVLFVAGQSNAANYAGSMRRSHFGGRIINYVRGNCFVAADPLLGSDGDGGSMWVRMANLLVAAGTYDRVMIVPLAWGGSSIVEWQNGGHLNGFLDSTLADLATRHIPVSAFVWVQGEADRMAPSPYYNDQAGYGRALSEVFATVRRHTPADIYLALASSCPNQVGSRYRSEPVRAAQQAAASEKDRIFIGMDLDAVRDWSERYQTCHLTAEGVDNAVTQLLKAMAARTPVAAAPKQ